MATVQRVVLPYSPRRIFLPYHDRTARWACIVAHRRAGKTVACINDLIKRAITLGQRNGRFAYVAPFLSQAKDVAWDYLKQFAEPIIEHKNESELWVRLVNGSRIRIHGADNADALRGSYLDGIILDEYADMKPSVWGLVIRPMLADRRGWATFIGTPKGRNEFWEVYNTAGKEPNWFRLDLKASETKILDAAEYKSLTEHLTPDQIEQEMECSFDAAITGAYFGKAIADAERAGHIRSVPYEPMLPVHTAWDLGKGKNMAIWMFQVVGDEIRVIDHHEGLHSEVLPEAVAALEGRPYQYGDDYVPHDARVPDIGTGRTRVETLISLGRKPRLVPRHGVQDGINAAILTIPRCWFDRDRCAPGIEALRQYKADFDEKTKAFKDAPRHDWTSHSADAFRYLAMAYREITAEDKPRDPYAELLRPRTFDDVMAEYEHEMADE